MSRSQRRKIKNQAKARKNSNDFDKKRCQKQLKKSLPAKNDNKNREIDDSKDRRIEKIVKGKKKKLKSKCLVKYCPSDCNSNFEMKFDKGLQSTNLVHHEKSNSIKSISSCHQGLLHSSPVFPHSLLLGTSELSYALTQGMPYKHPQDTHRNMINYSKDNHAAITRGDASNRGAEMASRHRVSYQSRQQTSSSIRHAIDRPKTPSIRYVVHENGAQAASKQGVFYQHAELTSSGIKHPSSQTDTLTRGGSTLEKIKDLSSQKVMTRRSELALRANTKNTYSRQTTQGGVSIPEHATQPTEALYLRQGDQRTAGKLTCSKLEHRPATGQASENDQPPHDCDGSRYETCQNPTFIDVLSEQISCTSVQNCPKYNTGAQDSRGWIDTDSPISLNENDKCSTNINQSVGLHGENNNPGKRDIPVNERYKQTLSKTCRTHKPPHCMAMNENVQFVDHKVKGYLIAQPTQRASGSKCSPKGKEFTASEQTEEIFGNENLRKGKEFTVSEQTEEIFGNENLRKDKEFTASEQTEEIFGNENLRKGKEFTVSEQTEEIFGNENLRKDKEFTVSEQTKEIFGNEHLPNGNEFIVSEQTGEVLDNEHLEKGKEFIASEQTQILYNEHLQKGNEFIISEQTGEVLDHEHLSKSKESVASERNDKVIVGRASLEDMELQKADEAVDSEQTEEILVGRASLEDMELQKADEAVDSEQTEEILVGRARQDDMELQKADEAVDSEQTEEILVGRASLEDMELQKADEAVDSEQTEEILLVEQDRMIWSCRKQTRPLIVNKLRRSLLVEQAWRIWSCRKQTRPLIVNKLRRSL